MPFGFFRRTVRVLPETETVGEDVELELQFHLQSRVDELARAGSTPEAARAQALREFGDLTAARTELVRMDRERATRRAHTRWWADLGIDVRFAGRTLIRQKGFAMAVVATLALGIGASAAIFTLIDAALLHPLPFRDSERLVHLWETYGPGGQATSEASYPDFLDWRAGSTALPELAGYDETNVTVTEPAGAVMVRGARVTAGFFHLLGVNPVLGRSFAVGEDGPGGSDVVLLTDRFWRRVTGADPGAIGRTLSINHRSFTIIGVLPPGFRFAPAGDAELWLPVDRPDATRALRGNHWLNVVGRLDRGTTLETAQHDLATIMSRLEAAYPETNGGRGVRVVSLRDQVTGDVQPVLLALFAAVGVLLLIACFNVAGLILTRSLGRARELGLRGAIGASRGRLVRQLLTETTVLAIGGAVVGFGIARAGVISLVAAVPGGMLDQMPYLRDARPDGIVLVFTVCLTVLTAIACGLAPAWIASRVSPTTLLSGAARSTGSGMRGRLRDVLVTGQLSLTAVLLIGAALVGRSLLRLLRERPGFATDHVLTLRVPLAGAAYQEATAQQRFFETLMKRIHALPGVSQVGAVTNLPLNGGNTIAYHIEGEPEPLPSARPEAVPRGVAGDYFEALQIPLVEGRVFDVRDDSAGPRAVIINRSLARQLFPGGSAVGRTMRFYAFPELSWSIVGVVGDVKTGALDAAPPPTVYYSHLQAAENRLTLAIRGTIEPSVLTRSVRGEVRAMDPSLPVYQVATMGDVISAAQPALVRRYSLLLIGAFAVSALLLAVVGIYGTVALSVAQRSRELGIRAALGATRAQLLSLVLRHTAWLVVAGAAAGGVLALGFGRFVQSLLYATSPTDPMTYFGVMLGLSGAAVVASVVPARRAARTDPAAVLRAE